MSHARFKIVFNGELMPDAQLDEVKDNLAKLFKSDRAKINSLFSGSSIALKRDLPEAEADKYLAALQRVGAKARKEADLTTSLSLVDTEDHGGPAAEPDEAARMQCPKCGHEQAKASECSACGIIIDKFLARQAEQAELMRSATPVGLAGEVLATATPYAPPTADVAETLPEFAELRPFSIEGRIGRLRYLAWSLAVMLAAACVFGIVAIGAAISPVLGIILGGLTVIGAVVVSTQIGVQRLHDIGWSGWLLLVNLVPVVGSVFALIMFVVPGSSGANRFGPPPPANSRGVKILAALWLLVPVLGIVAAISLPAYQDYITRAHDAQANSAEVDSAAAAAEYDSEAEAPSTDTEQEQQ